MVGVPRTSRMRVNWWCVGIEEAGCWRCQLLNDELNRALSMFVFVPSSEVTVELAIEEKAAI